MHEMTIAEAVIQGAVEEWRRLPRPARITRAGIAIGDLHQVVEDNFRLACEVLARGTVMEGVPIAIRRIPVRVTCKTCGRSSRIEPPFFVCPVCGGTDLNVTSGNELHLEHLEIETDDDENADHKSV